MTRAKLLLGTRVGTMHYVFRMAGSVLGRVQNSWGSRIDYDKYWLQGQIGGGGGGGGRGGIQGVQTPLRFWS